MRYVLDASNAEGKSCSELSLDQQLPRGQEDFLTFTAIPGLMLIRLWPLSYVLLCLTLDHGRVKCYHGAFNISGRIGQLYRNERLGSGLNFPTSYQQENTMSDTMQNILILSTSSGRSVTLALVIVQVDYAKFVRQCASSLPFRKVSTFDQLLTY